MSRLYKIQFIKNFKGGLCSKPFRKYNIIYARYSTVLDRWVHHTKYGIHFIPTEYVKIYKH